VPEKNKVTGSPTPCRYGTAPPSFIRTTGLVVELGQGQANLSPLTAETNEDHAPGAIVSTGPLGSFESRTGTVPVEDVGAHSTQDPPLLL
jgi:hypothetical protein